MGDCNIVKDGTRDKYTKNVTFAFSQYRAIMQEGLNSHRNGKCYNSIGY